MSRKRVEFRLAPGDVSAIRFGQSPGHELVHAVRALARPQDHPLQWGWVRAVRANVPRDTLDVLRLVAGEVGYAPDFLTSQPAWGLTPVEELERLRAAPLGPMRVDLAKRAQRSTGEARRTLVAMAERPVRSRRLIANAVEEFWAIALAPYWPAIERVLHADIGARVRRMSADGIAAMASQLNEAVDWSADAVRVRTERHEEVIDCTGRGLVLVPSLFSRRCAVLTEPPAQPTLFYPALGVAETWHRPGTDGALAALMGDRRAAVLRALREPSSTSEAASAAGIAISTASHHLDILRAAGLVMARRDGRRVVHQRTPLGEALAHAT